MNRAFALLILIIFLGGIIFAVNQRRSHSAQLSKYTSELNIKFYLDNGNPIRPDVWTFQIVNARSPHCIPYAKDKNHAYVSSEVIPKADARTFQLVDNCGHYAKDATHVFYLTYALQDADPATFTFAGGNFFGKDLRRVFYRSTVISGADVTTFHPIFDPRGKATLYSKDANHVYVSSPQSEETTTLTGADPYTFVAFDTVNPPSCGDGCTYYAQDKNHKYMLDHIVD